MSGWLIYSKKDAKKNKSYIEFYMDEGMELEIQMMLIYLEDLEFGVRMGKWFLTYQQKEISLPDFVICRTIYPLLTKQLEYMGLKVFNNSMVAEICNDKAKTYQYVAQLGLLTVDSVFIKHPRIKEKIKKITEPSVIKSVDGHGGSQVFFLPGGGFDGDSTEVELLESNIITKMKASDAVLQPLTGSKNQDLRIYVIGKQIIAAILRTSKEGFRSNYSLGGEVRAYELSGEEREVVNQIISLFDFGLVGIDFIIGDKGELIFNEIEDVVGARMLYQCTDINLVKLYLQHIKKKLSFV